MKITKILNERFSEETNTLQALHSNRIAVLRTIASHISENERFLCEADSQTYKRVYRLFLESTDITTHWKPQTGKTERDFWQNANNALEYWIGHLYPIYQGLTGQQRSEAPAYQHQHEFTDYLPILYR